MRRSLQDLGAFDDIVWNATGAAHVRPTVAFMASETADIWAAPNVATAYARADYMPYTFGTAGSEKRALFLALRHAQLQVDVVIEEDCTAGHLSQYSVLVLSEPHLSSAAATSVARWVHK